MRHWLLILSALLALAACGQTEEARPAEEGFIRLPALGASMTAGYLTIETEQADRLTAVSVEGVERTEMHVSFVEDGINRMRQVDGFELTPDEPLILEPRGRHLMLIGIDEALVEGDTREVTLKFESGRTEVLELPIKATGGQN
jgi:copper(I)-binding protein